jgi:hypothetical protein
LSWTPLSEQSGDQRANRVTLTHELATNVLDLLSFFLVTPEVLGRDRIEKLRAAVLGMFKDPDWVESISLLLGGAVVFGLLAAYSRYRGPVQPVQSSSASLWWVIPVGIVGGTLIIVACGLIGLFFVDQASRLLADRPMLRQRLLYAGGAVFLTSRVIGIWYA